MRLAAIEKKKERPICKKVASKKTLEGQRTILSSLHRVYCLLIVRRTTWQMRLTTPGEMLFFTIYALATLSLVYNLSHSVTIASCCGEGTLDGLAMIQGGYGGVWTKSSFKGSLVCCCLPCSVHNWSLCAVVEQEFSVMGIGWGVHGQLYLFYFELWKRVRRSTCSFSLIIKTLLNDREQDFFFLLVRRRYTSVHTRLLSLSESVKT